MTIGYHENNASHISPSSSEILGSGRCHQLAAMIAGSLPGWSVELHYDEDRKPALVVMPKDLDDTIGSTLIIYSSGSAFNLDELQGDCYRQLGEQLAWADTLRAVQIRLIWQEPFPTTVH